MKDEVLFSEIQHFRQWWLWTLLLGLNSLNFYGIYKQLFLGQPFGDNPASDTTLIVITIFIILLTLLFISFRLETRITNDGVYVRFLPFQKTFRYYAWQNLIKSYVRTYSPILEYGGWGLRFGIFSKDGAYNISGNKGLQLVTVNREKLLIGTQKPEELAELLRKINQLKE